MPDAEEELSPRSRELVQDLPALARRYGLGRVHDWRYLPHGLMNANWRITADAGDFALKRLVDVSAERAERNFALSQLLVSAGIPVCAPRLAHDGALVQRVGTTRAYALFDWVFGRHTPGRELTVEHAAYLGDLLGRLHLAIERVAQSADWPAATGLDCSKAATLPAVLAEADRFLRLIAARPSSGDMFDAEVARDLELRRSMLCEHISRRPADGLPLGPCGWTHGDFQYRNLLWDDGRVVAILDWDRVGVRALAEEVARTVAVQFVHDDGTMELRRVRAFTVAYRAVVPLRDEDLIDAARRLWWRWATDLWPLAWHYERGDRSCDSLWSSQARQLEWWCGHFDEVEDAVANAAPKLPTQP